MSRPTSVARPDGVLLTAWVLLLLEADATHGYDLAGRLARTRLEAGRSAIYRTLRRLERNGDVCSNWADSLAGPQRRVYRLTPSGRTALVDLGAQIAAARDLDDSFLRALAGPRYVR